MQRRQLLASVAAGVTAGLGGCGAGGDTATPAFTTASAALEGETLPARFSCDGDGASPPIEIGRTPEPTAALAVTADRDGGPLTEPVLWSLWNVPADTERIPAGLSRTRTVNALDGARQGRRKGGEVGYEPPCPPEAITLELRFQVYALGERLAVEGGTSHDDATEAIRDATIASRRFTLRYAQSGPGAETGTDR